jgi:hypothetical protein
MWNPLKKKKKEEESPKGVGRKAEPTKMNMMQRLAMKKLEKMSPEEREKLMKKVMTPENIHKHKDQILSQMDEMKRSGQMNQQQYDDAKRRLGFF